MPVLLILVFLSWVVFLQQFPAMIMMLAPLIPAVLILDVTMKPMNVTTKMPAILYLVTPLGDVFTLKLTAMMEVLVRLTLAIPTRLKIVALV